MESQRGGCSAANRSTLSSVTGKCLSFLGLELAGGSVRPASPTTCTQSCAHRGQPRTDAVQALNAGADDFLTKPVSIDELRGRIRAGERILKLQQRLDDKNKELEVANQQLQTAFERIESDLRAAAWVQENMLPSPHLNALGVACNWRYRPASYSRAISLTSSQLTSGT